MQKICKGKGSCGQLKDLSEFGTYRRNTKTGLKTYVNSLCKVCIKKRDSERAAARRADPEIRKKYNADRRAYYQRKKLGIKRPQLQTYEGHMAKRKCWRREHQKYKTEKYKVKRAKYLRERRRTDPNFRLLQNLRTRLNYALKGNSKSARTRELLGISVEGCRQHIEAQFLEGMCWENYGEWHVDHIVPCDSFNLKDAQEQRLMCHYTNLQPLWGSDNERKGSTLTPYAAQRKWTGKRWVNTLAPWIVDLST